MPSENSNTSPLGWKFDNSYATLHQTLFTPQQPVPVAAPQLLYLNRELSHAMGLNLESADPALLASVFSGNQLPEGAHPLAQAYAGHQFGYFNMLGDGRALLLGEHIGPDGKRYDIQLKGSGPTPYSRRGDGRATLSAMLREYLISEAMHHLGIRSSRSLALVTTGETVPRERIHPGGVLTRIASSHIRVGTFEYVSAFQSRDVLEQLLSYTIERHYPQLKDAANPALALLQQVQKEQISLVVQWMRVGFIHGVMNTDNMSLAGETIDYGPCAFMNAYDPKTVFSSIDHEGRYAYGNQPAIAQWNLACLARTIIPLVHPEEQKAVELVQETIHAFPDQFRHAWREMLLQKTGLTGGDTTDVTLAEELLGWMQQYGADFTNTFRLLTHAAATEPPAQPDLSANPFYLWAPGSAPASAAAVDQLHEWLQRWYARLLQRSPETARGIMQQNNPAFIPRNQLVETALEQAAFRNNFSYFNELLQILGNPYAEQNGRDGFQMPPMPQTEQMYQTFCNT
ncbi:MAG TPA: YdiU family protein [Lacibacter sp.]|nr:YdiU family protein [Lacibacter sp.]HMO87995.1 YdiU family protein [Lacibacter sp.]HMP87587.1 YdiU family protein [Lacibacter sp.]